LPEPAPNPPTPIEAAENHALPSEEEIVMLDVHPPHAAAHSWRDIFIHLATITIGLFIALSLEGGVEWVHHRHLVAEARENIRTEITANQKLLAEDVKAIRADERQMQSDMDNLRALSENPKAHESITLAWSWSSLSGSAWQTARDTGALSYMPYEKVQGFADVYSQQDLVNEAGRTLLRNQTQALIPLLIEKPSAPSTPAQIDEALHRCAETYTQLQLIEDLIKGLDRNYTDALRDL
jgi:hypothetical protein